ncbi:MAG: DNA polymerase III subunit gamma/tau [Paludibacteraceae bacterium]|nr:DNA polymerase III subunit gamma/tau [Paludibacteraceae bacterium]
MENYIVSARKYRPTTFESVVGQQALTQTLRNAIRTNRLAHAYLFCGPRGVGKTTCARIFAKTINCLNPTADHEACNVCESCAAFNEQRSFNIHELDAASNNSVEDIRSLIDQVRIPPQIGKYSVYIIDEVHMLSSGAFNALLKTLEEPPSYAIFILATTEKHKVLPTILSRCQVYDFSRITVLDTIRHLQYVAKQEGINASEEALNVVAQKADGGMRDALSIFDQLVSFCGKTITYEQTIEVLNVLDTEYYFRLVDAALTQNVSAALLLLNEVLVKGFDAGHFVTGFAQHLRDVLVSKDAATVQLLETSDAIRQHYQEQATRCNAKWLFQALDIVNTCDINYRTARNKRLTVELALVKLCTLGINIQAPVQPTAPTHTSTAKSAPQSAPTNTASVPQPVSAKPASAPVDDVAKPIAKPAPKAPTPAPKPTMGTMPSLGSLGVINTNGVGPTNPNNSTASATTSTNSVKRNNPFTLDQLKSAWVGQIKNFQSEERFKAMLTTYDPEMDSENVFHITVANALQKKEFAKFGKQLMDAIRDTLQNDLLQLHVRVAEYTPSQMAYTASEKYKLLNEMNSHLGELRERMNLQLE